MYRVPAAPLPLAVEGDWPGGTFAGLVGTAWQPATAADRILAHPGEALFSVVDVEIPGSNDESLAQAILDALGSAPGPAGLARVARRVLSASAAVEARPRATRGGATLAVLEIEDGWASIARLGDTAAFLARREHGRETFARLTDDDDLARRVRREPAIAHDVDPLVHLTVIMSALDGTPRRELEVVHRRLERGDRLVLVTDGVTRLTSHEAMAEVLARRISPAATCEALLALRGDKVHGDAVVLVVEVGAAG